MKKPFTEEQEHIKPPFPAACLRPEFRARLLASMAGEKELARLAQLTPAPLSPAFRARLQDAVAEAARPSRHHFVTLRWQYGAAACVVLCAMVGSLFCIAPQEGHSEYPALQATASRVVSECASGTHYYDTMTIVAADKTVLRVRSNHQNHNTLSEDVI